MTQRNIRLANSLLAEMRRPVSRSPQERIALGNALSVVLLNSRPPSRLRVFLSNLLKVVGLKGRDICDVCRNKHCNGERHDTTKDS